MPNIGIVTAYNDMLSAHQPYGRYPELIKLFAREAGATAQVAGGVPAMCDGVTQGQAGMDLSLNSRDTIALSTAVALSHAMFERVALLGICDKIVPGPADRRAALRPPAGAVHSFGADAIWPRQQGEAARPPAVRRGQGDQGRTARCRSRQLPRRCTCTFYGTANSNQMMLEMMGLQLPGSSFVNPGTRLRQELTRTAVHRLAALETPLGHLVDERAIVNAIAGLLATGGSTNHAIHIPAIAPRRRDHRRLEDSTGCRRPCR